MKSTTASFRFRWPMQTQEEYYTSCSAGMAYGVVIPNFLTEDDAKFAAYMIDVCSAGGKQ